MARNSSPFPGMDPYLEGDLWQEFHTTLAHQIRNQLLAVLPSNYVALLNKRYVLEQTDEVELFMFSHPVIYPDVAVTNVWQDRERAAVHSVEVAAPTLTLMSAMREEIPLVSIEIRDIAERRLITVIEILSPVNKRGKGYDEYCEKRANVLQTATHLLEIDLLRGGKRITLIGGKLPPGSYYIFLSRFNRRPLTEVWAISLRDVLPTIPVPLLPPDPDIPLDLQAAVKACFNLVGYQRLLDYNQPPPPPPLSDDEAQWACLQITQNYAAD